LMNRISAIVFRQPRLLQIHRHGRSALIYAAFGIPTTGSAVRWLTGAGILT
jgi:hypothetical protein